MSTVRLANVSKSYGNNPVLHDIDLQIADGELVVLVGPSGCGKSTLLRMICGLEPITAGELRIDDRVVNELPPAQRGIAMVFQSYALYPHMTVFDNLAFGLRRRAVSKAEIERRVRDTAATLGLADLLKRKPHALSGGQRQRVALGRAIVRDPKVFLFDEPLSNLDAALRVATRLEIAKLHHSMNGATMIYVTHDQVEAMTLADRICVLRDGVIEQVGTPVELYEQPQSLFVAGFIGSPKMNFLTGKFAEPYGASTIGIRSEHIQIGPGEGAWSGKVIHSENLGSDSYVYADMGTGEPVIVREDGTKKHQPDEAISIRPQRGQVHRFDSEGRPLGRQ